VQSTWRYAAGAQALPLCAIHDPSSRGKSMDEATLKLFARRHLSAASAEDAADWAIAQLQLGRETPSLLIVAGLDRTATPWEVDQYLGRAMSELGWEAPPKETALRWLAAKLARHLLAHPDAPPADLYRTVREIARLWMDLGYAPELAGMYSLEDDYTILNVTGHTPEQWRSAVLEEARALVNDLAF
jgi:hypothetical protein